MRHIILLIVLISFGCSSSYENDHNALKYGVTDYPTSERLLQLSKDVKFKKRIDSDGSLVYYGTNIEELVYGDGHMPTVFSHGYRTVSLTQQSPGDHEHEILLLCTYHGGFAYIEYKGHRGWVRSGDPLPGCSKRRNYYSHVKSINHRSKSVIVNIPFAKYYSGTEKQAEEK